MKNFMNKNAGIGIVLILIIALNVIASYLNIRADLTAEKRFTISEPVKKILRNIKEPVDIKIFLTGNLPSGFKKLSTSTEELLREFKEYAHGNIRFHIVDPTETITGAGISYADSLQSLGMFPINLKVQLKEGEQSQYIFPSALVTYQGRLQPVNLYSGTQTIITPPELNSSEAMLEYKFANAIEKVISNTKPLIAYTTGNGEPTDISTYDLVNNVLTKNFQLFTFDLKKEPIIPDTFKVLMMVKPTQPFDEAEKLKIDQYVMRGGKLLFFIDRLEAETDSLQILNQVIAYDRNLGLEDMLFRYGVRINPDLIMDLQSDFLPFNVNNGQNASGQGPQFEFLHWNYFPLFESKQNSVINKNLGLVAGRFVNSIDTVGAPAIAKTILLSTSNNSRTIATPALISSAENRNAPEDAAFNKKDIPVAVLLEGKFTSIFKNRVSRASMDTLSAHGTPFLTENQNNNKIIVVADGDIVLNRTFQDQPIPMGMNSYTIGSKYEYQFANRQFVENCLEYLTNEDGLSEAKAKDYTLRLLDPRKTAEERNRWTLLNLTAPVLIVIIWGAGYQWWRKRKYNKS